MAPVFSFFQAVMFVFQGGWHFILELHISIGSNLFPLLVGVGFHMRRTAELKVVGSPSRIGFCTVRGRFLAVFFFVEECSLFGQFFTRLSLPDSFETFPLPCELNMRYFLWKLKDRCSQTERLWDWCNLVSSVLRISICYVVPSKHFEISQHPVDGRNPAPVDR